MVWCPARLASVLVSELQAFCSTVASCLEAVHFLSMSCNLKPLTKKLHINVNLISILDISLRSYIHAKIVPTSTLYLREAYSVKYRELKHR